MGTSRAGPAPGNVFSQGPAAPLTEQPWMHPEFNASASYPQGSLMRELFSPTIASFDLSGPSHGAKRAQDASVSKAGDENARRFTFGE